MPKVFSRFFTLAWTVSCLALAVTGAGQMPIFKRYYIADLPGMAWTADFFLLHTLHYLAAAVFLALAAAWLGARLAGTGAGRLTSTGFMRVLAVVALAVTGGLRVAKNMRGVWLDPDLLMFVDWLHLVAALALGMLVLWAMRRGREPYAEPRGA